MNESAIGTVEALSALHPADLADRLQRMEADEARLCLRQLPAGKSAAAIAELEHERLEVLLNGMPTEQVAQFLDHLAPADAVDVLQALAPPDQRAALARLPATRAAGIRELLRYPPESAGGIMSDRFIALDQAMTVSEVRERLSARGSDAAVEDIAYLYVVDGMGRLAGIVGLRDLVFARPERSLGEIMRREVRFARVLDDQEELARKFEHYHYLGLPVLDDTGRLVGVVKASDAIEVARNEATEDMQLMVGLSGEERALTPWAVATRRRLPWLCLNLGTAFLAAATVGHFEDIIAEWTALAVFLPMVAGQGGNAGMQTLTVLIRDLALGEIAPGDGKRILVKEIILGLVNGLAIGAIVAAIAWFWKGSGVLALVAGVAMLLNQLAAALAGVVIPLGLRSLRLDPALASSIFLTTVTDVAGFCFFLGLAKLGLRWVG